MAKQLNQLNVNLAFTADTAKAQAQIRDLQQSLDKLSNMSNPKGLGITKELQEAQLAAAKLKVVLDKSLSSTGNLDLTKLYDQLAKGTGTATQALTKYQRQLSELGPAGDQAFASLSRSIASAEMPLKRTSALLSEFKTTMANTVRWQVSSSLLHGFMGSIQSAYHYAEDLNESLNNIRIVTGQSTDQMAKFAKQANLAAKELSTTTTKYTDAALIFYQQGLSDNLVKEYTDVTIKMANVTGDGAQEVSSYMTAIWNNFNKNGDYAADHFADVLTALGAATASSTSEISAGLEKFASIADVTGLSYDYAASALATLIANTRQSADVVGTSLKTIFSRMEGLKLGETLEDGVDLNKYSEALQTIGVNVLDASGNLKDLDNILDDTAEKWDTLSRAQQMATAQTVAGVRQYNNFISLMDNWDDMEDNLATARNSDGELDKQADIYAESWEAARDRVTAAAQGIYNKLLDDKFFINMLDSTEYIITGIDHLIDSMGGLAGVIGLLGTIGTKVFATELSGALDRFTQNLMMKTAEGQQRIRELQTASNRLLQNMNIDQDTTGSRIANTAYSAQASVQDKMYQTVQDLARKKQELSEIDQRILQLIMDQHSAAAEQLITSGQELEQAETENNLLERRLQYLIEQNQLSGNNAVDTSALKQQYTEYTELYNIRKQISQIGFSNSSEEEKIKKISALLTKATEDERKFGQAGKAALQQFSKDLQQSNGDAQKIQQAIAKLDNVGEKTFDDLAAACDRFINAFQVGDNATDEERAAMERARQAAVEFVESLDNVSERSQQVATNEATLSNVTQQFEGALDNASIKFDSLGTTITKSFNAISSIEMGIMSLKGAFDALNNQDMSVGEKIMSISSSMMIAIPSLVTGVMSLSAAITAHNAAVAAGEALTLKQALASGVKALADKIQSTALWQATAAQWAFNSALLANPIGVVIVAIVALVAAVTALVFAFKAFNSESPDEKLKACEERAEKAQDAFDNLKGEINETKDALDKLQDSQKTLDDLTKGTEEWTKAVQETQAQVLELLDLYPELSQMGFLTNNDGVLQITDKGFDYINNQLNTRLLGAQNYTLQTQSDVAQAKLDKNYNTMLENLYDYGLENLILFGNGNQIIDKGGTAQDFISALQQYYEQAGDSMFTKEGADAILSSSLFDRSNYEYDEYAEEHYAQSVESLQEYLNDNKEFFQENQGYTQQVASTSDLQAFTTASSLGYTGSLDALKDLLGDNSYGTSYDSSREKVKGNFGNWNDHINYSEDDDEWGMIEDFMKLQGDNVKYVAQRMGNMVLEIDGEEVKFDKDDVYDQLASFYATDDLKEKLQTQLANTLGESLGGVDLSNADLDYLNLIDGFRRGIETAVGDSGMTDEIMQSLFAVSGGTEEGFQSLLQDQLSHLDFGNADTLSQIDYYSQQLQAGKISADEYAQSLKELDAAAKMDSMGEFFTQAAEGMGLKEEDAAVMHEYAKNIMEMAEDSDVFADSLKSDADSAADLAVEITRMNKGIDKLADGFEDWSDVLKKSSKESMEYSAAMAGMKDALADVLDVEADLISSDFVADHLDEIEKAAQGDEDAIDSLRASMDEEIMLQISSYQTEEVKAQLEELDGKVHDLADNLPDIKIGAVLQDEDFLEAANNLVEQSGMTADQANAYFAGIGYEPVYSTEDIENNAQVPNAQTTMKVTSTGWDTASVNMGILGTHDISLPTITYTTESTPLPATDAPAATTLTSFSGDSTPPKIKGMRRKAAGAQNNYSSSNAGGKSPGSGKKGGGGGGGSAPKHKTKENKDRKNEIERYHDVTEALEDVATQLDMIGKAKDRAFGVGKLKNIKSEIALLQQENKLLQQQYDEASRYLEQDKAEAAKYGWSYDKNGDIANYESNMNRLLDKLEAETNYYNNLSAEAQKKYDETLDANDKTKLDRLQEEYDKAIAAKDKLEESSDKVRDTLKQMQEVAQQIADAELESIEVIVNLTLEVDDAQLKYLQALFDNIGDSADNAADKIENIEKQIAKFGKQMEHQKEGLESYLKLAQKYSKGLSNDAISNIIDGTASDSDLQALAKAVSNSDGTLDMNTIMDKVKDFQSACYDNIERLKEWRDSVYETLQDAMDQYDEKFDRIDNKIAHSSKMIQSYKDLVAAIGKKNVDPTGQLTARMDQNAIKTSESAYRVSQAQSEYWKKAVADAQEGLAAAKATGVEADIKYWEDILNDATDKLYESEEDAMSKLNEWVTQLGEAFQHQIEQVIDNLNQSLGGLSDLREAFDRAQEIDAQYIDDYQKIYELSKLTRQVNTSIDETDNVKAKKALMEYQQKINEYQADGVQMSEYELQYLQKQYDLELAKIALDEAQDAKSQVRMTRDSEGNYGYVYTADESAVEKAEQSYEDKLYEMQELNAQYINDLQDNIITMQEEMSSKLQEIAEDDSLSYEEKMAKMQEVTDYYSERIDYYSKQLGIVLDNNKSLYENDWKEYSEKTGYKISKDEDYIDSWDETTIAIQTGAETQDEYITNVKNSMRVACDDMQDALSDYQQAVRDATDEVIDGSAEQTDALAETAEEAAKDAEELETDYEDTLGEAMDATQQFTEDYAKYIDDCIQANLDYIDSINDVLAKLRELAAEEGSGSGKGKGSGDKSGKDGGSDSGDKSGKDGGSGAGSIEGVAAAIWMDGGVTSGWYNGNDRTSRLKEKGLTAAQAYINAHGPNGDIYAAWHDKREQLKSFYYGSFDTGGYTGEWGDGSGKLALLHSKELVLNAADTENMLKMVDMVRQISNMIDINALSSSLTSGLTAASVNANNNGVLEQQVTITAEFPNATDKDQILDAFDNVINLAAQYANRK